MNSKNNIKKENGSPILGCIQRQHILNEVDSVSLPAPELKFMLIFNVLQHLSSAQTGCLFFRELIANSNHVEFINQALSQIGLFKVINEKCLIHCLHFTLIRRQAKNSAFCGRLESLK